MTKSIRFTKMHGAGNDYIYVNTMVYPIDNPEELSIAWSKPHTGIGSDGLDRFFRHRGFQHAYL